MSVDKSDSECADDSSDCSNKFWHRPDHDQSEATINESSDSLGANKFGGILTEKSKKKDINSNNNNNSSNSNTNGNAASTSMDDDRGISKRRQTKMLLVSLIESFCRVHGDSPEANRYIFFLICQTLSSLGFIDSEFVDEMAGVRSTFQSAFQTLFYTAVETVNDPSFRKPMMIASSSAAEDDSQSDGYQHCHPLEKPQQQHIQQQEQRQKIQQQRQRQRQESFHQQAKEQPPIFDLNIQNSRYCNDFVQVSLLGRGGFASVWRAHNKLDNIDYAVKQIHLGPDLTDDDRCGDEEQGPYEKIFREIKHLARLEHKNVVRYYSSWLEYTTTHEHSKASARHHHHQEQQQQTEIDNEKEEDNDNDSIFGGQDPTFDDPDDDEPTFSSISNQKLLEDMSLISFTNDNHDNDVKNNKKINNAGNFIDIANNSSAADCISSETTNNNKDTAVCIPNVDPKRSTRKERERRMSKKRSRTKRGLRCGWTLYIQMYLCPATLHDYIKHRNDTRSPIDKDRNIELFTQILEGCSYIHSSGLIHRDLKPSNIFLTMTTSNNEMVMNTNGSKRHWRSTSSSHTRLHHQHSFSYDSVRNTDGTLRDCMWNETLIPKLGDFGLAAAVMTTHCKQTPPSILSTSSPMTDKLSSFMEHHHRGSQHSLRSLSSSYCRRGINDSSSSSSSSSSEEEEGDDPCVMHKLTSAVGTRTYAAPEQLAEPPRPYDDKADIYSLGIIFFELYQPFTTVMERACAIERLKKGVFPDGFVEMYPKESALILWMMDDEPGHRPSAEQLLEFELFLPQSASEEGMYSNLQAQLQAKSVALDTKDKEMAALRDKMEKIEQQNKKDMEVMQKRVDELQRQLSMVQLGHAECTPSFTATNNSNSSNSNSRGLSKMLTHDTLCK